MRFGLVCFVVLFFGTELFHWLMGLGQFELSLPMTILAGGGLAIASNLPRSAKLTEPEPAASATQPQTMPSAQPLTQTNNQDTISFKIKPPFQSR